MKNYLLACALAAFVFSCSNNGQDNTGNNESGDTYQPAKEATEHPELEDEAENNRGIGKFKSVDLPATLDAQLATAGKAVYDMKCYSCHKLTEERLVGPGWKGVTGRRAPEWIMNFSTNTDEMLNKDAQAQAMLETCLIRMPNQNLTDEDARKVLEFMRQNDGVK
ncbi:MAG: cytochrome c [Chitinophagales bacterium]|nr:cytochrome c [Chitinophagales bacterium]